MPDRHGGMCYGVDCLILNRMQNDCVQWIRGNIIKKTIVVFRIIQELKSKEQKNPRGGGHHFMRIYARAVRSGR